MTMVTRPRALQYVAFGEDGAAKAGGSRAATFLLFREQLLATKLKPLAVPGGYFQLVDYSAVSDLDDAAFCRWLTIEKGVAAIPLSPFYETPPAGQRLARLCFAKNDATMDAAIQRLQAL